VNHPLSQTHSQSTLDTCPNLHKSAPDPFRIRGLGPHGSKFLGISKKRRNCGSNFWMCDSTEGLVADLYGMRFCLQILGGEWFLQHWGTTQPKLEFPMEYHPESPKVSKRDLTGLGSKGNIQRRSRGQEQRPSPLFSPNPPINSCPKVSMISKLQYSVSK